MIEVEEANEEVKTYLVFRTRWKRAVFFDVFVFSIRDRKNFRGRA
jgi:hypothetical protein